jgi:adenylate cyclase
MKNKHNAPEIGAGTIRFPIGAKLVLIVTVILLVSLGAISFLVSWMVSRDLRVSAEDNNLSVNRRAAAASETILSLIRSNALVLLKGSITGGNQGSASDSSAVDQFAGFFFEQNRHIAALALFEEGGEDRFFINPRFSGLFDLAAIAAYAASREGALRRAAAGDTLLLDASLAAAQGSGTAFPQVLLGFFFPLSSEASSPRRGAALALFFAEALLEIFGPGTNTSFLINDDGDVLVHPGLDSAGPPGEATPLDASGGADPLVMLARQSGKPFMQTLYIGPDGKRYFGAFSAVSQGYVITHIEESLVFEGIAATTRRNIYLTGTVLFLAIILVWFFSKTISGPVRLWPPPRVVSNRVNLKSTFR